MGMHVIIAMFVKWQRCTSIDIRKGHVERERNSDRICKTDIGNCGLG